VGLGQREVPEREQHVVLEELDELFHDRMGQSAERALVVAVLDEGDLRRERPDRVIFGADRSGKARAVEKSAQVGTAWRERDSSAVRIPSAPGLTPIGDT
jgi:hypothetical protein